MIKNFQPGGSAENTNSNNTVTVPVVDGRKKNFFERKRFVNYSEPT